MRVLLISHTYFPAIYRGKLRCLARLPGLELQLAAVPAFGALRYESSPDDTYPQHLLRSWPASHNVLRVYSPLGLGQVLNRFRPDIVHVEAEPHALALTQILLMRTFFPYRVLFFTWENLGRTLPWPARVVRRFNLARADAALAGSTEAVQVLRQRRFRGPISVVPQVGVDVAHTERASPHPGYAHLRAAGPVVGFAGRLEAAKGVSDLVEAFRLLPDAVPAHLLMVGTGRLQSALMRQAASLGLAERVSFTGNVAFEEVPRYLKCMDVLVLPSRTTPKWAEQFGHVLVEAMACGTPVIGSDSGAIPEVIGQAGLTYREGDVSSLAHRLQRVLSDADLRRELSQRGHQRVSEHFSDEALARRTYDVYRQLHWTEPTVYEM